MCTRIELGDECFMSFENVRMSLRQILTPEIGELRAYVESWVLAIAWLNSDKEKQQAVIDEIRRDLFY